MTKEQPYKPINMTCDLRILPEVENFFNSYVEQDRKEFIEVEKAKMARLSALLSLIIQEQKIKPSDLCLCVESEPPSISGGFFVKMYFKKRGKIK